MDIPVEIVPEITDELGEEHSRLDTIFSLASRFLSYSTNVGAMLSMLEATPDIDSYAVLIGASVRSAGEDAMPLLGLLL